MNSLDIWLLAVALAMDCFTVSIVSGVIVRRFMLVLVLRLAVFFGAFQALMPLIGWMATNHFSEALESIAFGNTAAVSYCHEYRCAGSWHFLCLYWLSFLEQSVMAFDCYRCCVVYIQCDRLYAWGAFWQTY